MTTELTASVVIPVHNNADTIEAQLDGLRAALTHAPDTEIVVVDNRSDDGLATIVRAWSAASSVPVRLVVADQQAGEPYARNVGIAATTTPILLFCDGDDVVSPDWIASLTSTLETASFATGPVLTDELNEPWMANVRGTSVFNRCPTLYDVVPFAHGCNMGFRRELLDELGGFDEALLAGCDQEIAVRAWRAGYTLAFDECATIQYRLRGDLRGTWRQGRSYGRYRIRVRALIEEHIDVRAERRARIRRAGWLVKSLPKVARDLEVRARWVWVSSQLVGEIHGIVEGRFRG